MTVNQSPRMKDGQARPHAMRKETSHETNMDRSRSCRSVERGLGYVGDTHEEGVRIGSKLMWFLNTSLKSAPQYARFLPGAVPPPFAPQIYRSAPQPDRHGEANDNQSVAPARQNAGALIGMSAEQAMQQGILFAGSPDTIYRQIMDFYTEVGGFDHLVMIGRSGFMTHAEAEKSLKLFAKEVLPRLQEVAPVTVG
jgi:alkanesulfonate monooxygenase SsuD/methylene tetrahydromethanopterin reductase-like flavin-dependent oxidoreductase (luciferase family)